MATDIPSFCERIAANLTYRATVSVTVSKGTSSSWTASTRRVKLLAEEGHTSRWCMRVDGHEVLLSFIVFGCAVKDISGIQILCIIRQIPYRILSYTDQGAPPMNSPGVRCVDG